MLGFLRNASTFCLFRNCLTLSFSSLFLFNPDAFLLLSLTFKFVLSGLFRSLSLKPQPFLFSLFFFSLFTLFFETDSLLFFSARFFGSFLFKSNPFSFGSFFLEPNPLSFCCLFLKADSLLFSSFSLKPQSFLFCCLFLKSYPFFFGGFSFKS